jgi:hypothetical protein
VTSISAASSSSLLQTVTAFVYGVLEPTVVTRVYIQGSIPRSESLFVKGFVCGGFSVVVFFL